tara:strand:+ start:77 stop:262 length:186 start_codon:yes stop_codon:yes gene_type:complete
MFDTEPFYEAAFDLTEGIAIDLDRCRVDHPFWGRCEVVITEGRSAYQFTAYDRLNRVIWSA